MKSPENHHKKYNKNNKIKLEKGVRYFQQLWLYFRWQMFPPSFCTGFLVTCKSFGFFCGFGWFFFMNSQIYEPIYSLVEAGDLEKFGIQRKYM